MLATDGAGMVYVAWRDKRVANLAQAYTARIDLTAATPAIQNTTRLQPNVSGASAEQIVIAAAGQNVYVAWTDLRAAAKAIRMAYSRNRGQSYSQVAGVTDGIVINQDSTFANATDPALAARSNRIVVAWADTRSGKADIRVNHSEDAAATWLASSPRVDTGDTLGATTSLLPRVALGAGNTVLVTWQDLRVPRSAVIANVSIDRGTTFYADAGGSYRMDTDNGAVPGADSQTPLVLGSDQTNRGSVVWVDFLASNGSNSQNGDIYARRIE